MAFTTVPNEAGVFYARKGFYKGKEVTVTHRDGAMVYLEDYPIGKAPVEYGCWVPNESVNYKNKEFNENKPNGKTKIKKKKLNKDK